MTIKQLVEQAYKNAVAHGWHEDERTFGEEIALCHSELSEALEDFRHGMLPTQIYFEEPNSNIKFEDREVVGGWRSVYKPCGIPHELADVVIRIADMCGRYGIDLEQAVKDKHTFNKNRPYKHGGKVI